MSHKDRPQNQVRIYTPEVLTYVIKNIKTLSYEEMAAHICCTVYGLKNQISKWRKEHGIPHKPYKETVPIGTISKRGNGVFKKTESGWVRVPKQNLRVNKIEVSKKKPKPKIRTDGNRSRNQKPTVRVFETRKQYMSNKVLVKIDSKTWVYRDKSKIV